MLTYVNLNNVLNRPAKSLVGLSFTIQNRNVLRNKSIIIFLVDHYL